MRMPILNSCKGEKCLETLLPDPHCCVQLGSLLKGRSQQRHLDSGTQARRAYAPDLCLACLHTSDNFSGSYRLVFSVHFCAILSPPERRQSFSATSPSM